MYDEAFQVLYDNCIMHNLHNRGVRDSTMRRYCISIENLKHCTAFKNAQYYINSICEQFVAIDRHILYNLGM